MWDFIVFFVLLIVFFGSLSRYLSLLLYLILFIYLVLFGSRLLVCDCALVVFTFFSYWSTLGALSFCACSFCLSFGLIDQWFCIMHLSESVPFILEVV